MALCLSLSLQNAGCLDKMKNNVTREKGETYGKVVHVGEEDVDLDDLLDAGAGRGEDGLQVLDARGRLLLDGALGQVAVDIPGDLAGAVDGGWGLDGVGLDSRGAFMP